MNARLAKPIQAIWFIPEGAPAGPNRMLQRE
jgi:hypothetical protein